MRVPRADFCEILEQQVRPAIRAASFVAIDTEFTGLSAHGAPKPGLLSPVQECYDAALHSTANFTVTQLGVACFVPNEDGMECKVFSFPVFPVPESRSEEMDRRFMVQAGSLTFLASNGFDFNSWIREGIPWAGARELRELSRKLADAKQRAADCAASTDREEEPVPEVPFRSARDKARFDEVMKTVSEWLEQDPKEPLALGNFPAFMRMQVHRGVKCRFGAAAPRGSRIVTASDDTGAMSVSLLSQAGELEVLKGKVESAEKALVTAQGMALVVRAISERGCPVVVHNGVLDLLHVYRFVGNPAAEVDGFAKQVAELFPRVVDTKHLAEWHPHQSVRQHRWTSVEYLFKNLERTKVAVSGLDDETHQAHDAGWDAAMTGVNYLSLIGPLSSDAVSAASAPQASGRTSKFINRLRLQPSACFWLQLGAGAEQRTLDLDRFVRLTAFARTLPVLRTLCSDVQVACGRGGVAVAELPSKEIRDTVLAAAPLFTKAGGTIGRCGPPEPPTLFSRAVGWVHQLYGLLRGQDRGRDEMSANGPPNKRRRAE